MRPAIFALACVVVAVGCKGDTTPELTGRYRGDVTFTEKQQQQEWAPNYQYWHRQYSFFFFRPNKYNFDGQGVFIRGTYRKEGDYLILTPDLINRQERYDMKPAEAKTFLAELWMPESKDRDQTKKSIEWITNPLKLKLSADEKRLDETYQWRGAEGTYFFKKE